MVASIHFNFSWEKAIEAIVWLAQNQPGISPYYIAKVLYYADKEHLCKYGRPVLGDRYIAMEHGPVPSGVYNLVCGNDFLDPEILEAMGSSIRTESTHVKALYHKREPNKDLFSESDLECLGDSLETYGKLPVNKLRDLTHQERAWNQAPSNEAMDYTLMIDDDIPDREDLIEEIKENAAYAVF